MQFHGSVCQCDPLPTPEATRGAKADAASGVNGQSISGLHTTRESSLVSPGYGVQHPCCFTLEGAGGRDVSFSPNGARS